MDRLFKDMISADADGKIRINLIDDNNIVRLSNVRIEVASKLEQDGDDWRSIMANLLLRIDDQTNVPVLRIDGGLDTNKPGTIQLYRSTNAPTSIEPGEAVVENTSGRLWIGNGNRSAIRQALYSELTSVNDALSSRITTAQNTANNAANAAAAAQSRANTAVSNAAAAQATANTAVSNAATAQNRANSAYSLAETKASLNGNNTFSGTNIFSMANVRGNLYVTKYNDNDKFSLFQSEWNGEKNLLILRLNELEYMTIVDNVTSELKPLYASNLGLTSSERYKEKIQLMPDDMAKKLFSIPIYSYKYTEKSGFDDGNTHYGWKAEEIAELADTLIYTSKDENGEPQVEGVIYDNMVPIIAKQNQMLLSRIEALENTISQMNNKKVKK